jgi:catechol 2,3-dioxygenase-like lactoylglutathione lyase family enzyme
MPEILASSFVLAVRDLAVSKRFYLEKLGFTEDFSVDGWAFLSRGACKIRLGHLYVQFRPAVRSVVLWSGESRGGLPRKLRHDLYWQIDPSASAEELVTS